MTDAGEDARVDLGRGVTMPMVGFGTWRLQRARAYEAVRYALEVGYRHIDTATMYQNEAEVGRAVRDSGLDRREVFITTKLPPQNAGRERATIDASLRALGTGYVDLWLVHWPPRGSASVPGWEQFRKIRDEGLARAVGVSNYDVAQVDELISASGEHPAVNQIPWSLPGYDPRLLAAMRELGVVVEGYSSLKNTDLRNPVLAQIAERHNVTPAQVVLRWHIQHGIPVIPKSAQPERIASNFALSGFALSPSEMSALDRLSRRLPGALSPAGAVRGSLNYRPVGNRRGYPQARGRAPGGLRRSAIVDVAGGTGAGEPMAAAARGRQTAGGSG
jgi:2,5-diketo-D-gluconate reductase A